MKIFLVKSKPIKINPELSGISQSTGLGVKNVSKVVTPFTHLKIIGELKVNFPLSGLGWGSGGSKSVGSSEKSRDKLKLVSSELNQDSIIAFLFIQRSELRTFEQICIHLLLNYSCNNITTTLIQISRLFYFGFFSKYNHQMII